MDEGYREPGYMNRGYWRAYKPWISCRAWPPSSRVEAAMARISRDRLVSPQDVARIGRAFVKCATSSPQGQGRVYNVVFNGYEDVWGMIGGKCPINPRSFGTVVLRERLRSEYRRNKIDSALITVLQIVAMERKYHARAN